MKILYYTDQTHEHGGIERVLAGKINYFVEQEGTAVFLLTTEQKGKPHRYPMSDKLIPEDLGINYNRKISYFNPKNFSKIVKHFWRLRRQLRQIDPDVVIIPNFDFSFYFLPFIHRKSKKIKEYHSSRYFESIQRHKNTSFLRKLRYRLTDYIERKYDSLVLLTPDEKQHYKSDNTLVIPNALERIPDKKATLQAKKAISAGRIAPVKGFKKLIAAWAFVAKRFPDWQLEIYGEGEKAYVDELKNQIKDLHLESMVCLCGQTQELEAKMLAASLYLMSSQTECYPMVLLEAQAVGLPIVSFDCPYGPRNIITHNIDGLLVENQYSDKLAGGIIELIKNKDLRFKMGENANDSTIKNQSDLIMNKWIGLFKL